MNCPPIYNDAVNVMKGVNGSTVNLIVTAHDVVDGQISPFCLTLDTLETVSQEYIFPVGETVVVCVATDRSNNTAWCFFYVYVLGMSVYSIIRLTNYEVFKMPFCV